MTTPIGISGAQQPIRGDGPGIAVRGVGGEGVSFADTLKQALNEVTALQEESRDAIGAFLRGEPIELHEVMAATEEAGIALELLIEIRNKLTEAYRTVINLQV